MVKNSITKAIKLYAAGKLSMGKAAELADISIWEFLGCDEKKENFNKV